MVDTGTRYVVLEWLRRNTTQLVIEAILDRWVYELGTPDSWLVDPAGEFVSNDFGNFCRRFSIDMYCVPTEAHWGNPAERYIQAEKAWIKRFLEANRRVAMSKGCCAAQYGLKTIVLTKGYNVMQRMEGGDLRLPGLMSSNTSALTPRDCGWLKVTTNPLE